MPTSTSRPQTATTDANSKWRKLNPPRSFVNFQTTDTTGKIPSEVTSPAVSTPTPQRFMAIPLEGTTPLQQSITVTSGWTIGPPDGHETELITTGERAQETTPQKKEHSFRATETCDSVRHPSTPTASPDHNTPLPSTIGNRPSTGHAAVQVGTTTLRVPSGISHEKLECFGPTQTPIFE